jgi:hypothetical protein
MFAWDGVSTYFVHASGIRQREVELPGQKSFRASTGHVSDASLRAIDLRNLPTILALIVSSWAFGGAFGIVSLSDPVMNGMGSSVVDCDVALGIRYCSTRVTEYLWIYFA